MFKKVKNCPKCGSGDELSIGQYLIVCNRCRISAHVMPDDDDGTGSRVLGVWNDDDLRRPFKPAGKLSKITELVKALFR